MKALVSFARAQKAAADKAKREAEAKRPELVPTNEAEATVPLHTRHSRRQLPITTDTFPCRMVRQPNR